MNRLSCQRQSGFTILELAAILALTSGLIFALSYKTADVAQQRTNQNTTQNLALADQHLREFAARVGRLPCPDSTNTGVEDCTVSKGYLPYRTLGLVAVGYQQGEIPIRYGVFRNAAAKADLAVLSNHFRPTNADSTTYAFNNQNSLDFCIGLSNAALQPVNTNYLYQQSPGFSPKPMAYMLAAPGQRDADGSGSPYDKLNGNYVAGFQAPNTPVSSDYDDQTRGRGFEELYNLMRCEATLRSLDLAANAIGFEEEVIAFALSNAETAKEGVFMGIVGTSIGAWNLAQAGAGLISANSTAGISAGLLSGVTASCAIPPFAGCALIPVYGAAVAAAGTGATLSGYAVGFAGTAVGLQITSTIMYNNIAKKTGVPEVITTPSIKPELLTDALADYNSKKAIADTAGATYTSAQSEFIATRAITLAAKDELENQINALSTIEASKLRDRLYGNPRPEDVDPDNPPDKATVIVGAAPAISAWRKAQSNATSFDGVILEDENGDPIDLNDSVNTAKTTADDEKNAARAIANANCPGQPNCLLNQALETYLIAHDNESVKTEIANTKQQAFENAQDDAKSAYIKYRTIFCTNISQDYDAQTDLCTPASTPTPPLPGVGDRVEFFQGMSPMVEVLDSKGTVQ